MDKEDPKLSVVNASSGNKPSTSVETDSSGSLPADETEPLKEVEVCFFIINRINFMILLLEKQWTQEI